MASIETLIDNDNAVVEFIFHHGARRIWSRAYDLDGIPPAEWEFTITAMRREASEALETVLKLGLSLDGLTEEESQQAIDAAYEIWRIENGR